MNAPYRLHRKRERRFSAHHMMLRTATRALANAQLSQVGSRYEFLISIVFSALAIEALANTLLERFVADWKSQERRAPMTKIRKAAEALKVKFSEQDEPWVSGIWLFDLRNRLAHAWPEHLLLEEELSQGEYDEKCFDQLEASLEVQITLGNADRAVKAAQLIHHALAMAVPLQERMGILVDGATASVRKA